MKQKTMTPFSNGTEFESWKSANCDTCDKYEGLSTALKNAKCKKAFYLDVGYVGEGTIPVSIAEQIGCDGDCLNAKCKEWKEIDNVARKERAVMQSKDHLFDETFTDRQKQITLAMNICTDSDDSPRLAFQKIFLSEDGEYSATDGHILAVSNVIPGGTISNGQVFVKSFISPSQSKPLEIDVSKLESFLFDKYPFEIELKATKSERCENCDGDGYVECCECGHEKDCDHCDGDGVVVIRQNTGEYSLPRSMSAEMLGERACAEHLMSIVLMAKIMGEEKITASFVGDKYLIKMNELTVVLMRMTRDKSKGKVPKFNVPGYNK